MKSTNLKLYVLNNSINKLTRPEINKILIPLFKNKPSNINIKEQRFEENLKKGEPLLGLSLTGGNEASFLEIAERNPYSPAVILCHDKCNSFAASCEISNRLHTEYKRGNRAPCIFVNINDKIRLQNILKSASVASYISLNKPKIGIIGKPSDWLIGSGTYADFLPKKFGFEKEDINIEEMVNKIKEKKTIYNSLREIIKEHKLTGFTIRCFDLLHLIKDTCCLEVSRLNNEGIISTCEGDIPAAITMHIMNILSGRPVFMANPTSIKNNLLKLAHCTIPTNLCKCCKITTHYESGIGRAIQGKVKEGLWTIGRFGLNRNLMVSSCKVINPKVFNAYQCRTQIIAQVQSDFAERMRNGEVLGNHLLLTPGDIKEALKIYAKIFVPWEKPYKF